MKRLILISLGTLLLSITSWGEVEQTENEPGIQLPHFAQWLEKACLKGHAKACFKLGRIYERYSQGHRAAEYFEIACGQNHDVACSRVPASTPPLEAQDPAAAEEAQADIPVVDETEPVTPPLAQPNPEAQPSGSPSPQ